MGLSQAIFQPTTSGAKRLAYAARDTIGVAAFRKRLTP